MGRSEPTPKKIQTLPPQLARKAPPINHFDPRPNFCHPQVKSVKGVKGS